MNDKRIKSLIISPSGNLYGSERVLLDYLKTTDQRYYIFVPYSGEFQSKVREITYHHLLEYDEKRITKYYLTLFLFILFKRIRTIYVNEGGHIRYIKILATLFSGRRFYLHLRIVEDVTKERLTKIPENLSLVTISQYMQNMLVRNGYQARLINDPYPFTEKGHYKSNEEQPVFISVIGRFTPTKGSTSVLQFFRYLNERNIASVQLNIFGNTDTSEAIQSTISELKGLTGIQVVFHGFVDNPDIIYSQSSVVVHFNRNEPLGRIFLEAIDHQVPFIGFNSGGIKEIAENCGLSDFMVEPDDHWEEAMSQKLQYVLSHPDKVANKLVDAKEKASEVYSVDSYTTILDKLLYE